MTHPLRIATANVNGIRAAYRRGMGEWLAGRGVDILALQEVRAETDDLVALLGPEWDVLHDAASAKGRAGVAIASRHKTTAIHRVAIGADDFDSAGRWLEADYEVGGVPITVVSAYVHSGEADTPKQAEKYKLLDGMTERLAELGGGHAVVLGDFNVGHRELDIKNWKGNLKRAGFLPEERAYFDRWIGDGWVDVGRRFAGEVPGPYTWWSWRGKSFDLDSGWRIDYHLASASLAPTAASYAVDRAPSYAERWSDHAPVVVDYAL
ncbi:MAG TPA: exodeoxyribonuclease III [Pseudolysinimonas sp.]|nr:exodeoxyribonuclease III [Pseudolysinimonas sp.]